MLIGGKITFSMTCRSVDDVKFGVKFTHASQANAIHGVNRVEGYHNHKQFIALFDFFRCGKVSQSSVLKGVFANYLSSWPDGRNLREGKYDQ